MLMIAVLTLSADIAFSAEASWTGRGTGGLWSDPANWSSNPVFPNNTAETTYGVTIQSQTIVNLDRDVEIDRFTFSSPTGQLVGSGSLVVNDSFRAERLKFGNSLIESRGEGYITDGYPSFTTTRFVNRGHMILDVGQLFTGYSGMPGTFVNETGGQVEFHTGFQLGFQSAFNPVPLENRGTWIHQAESTLAELPFNNDGRLVVEAGSLILAAGRNTGEIHVATGASLVMRNYFSIGDNSTYTGTGTIEIGARYQLPASIGSNYQFNGRTRVTGNVSVDGAAHLGSQLDVSSGLRIRSRATADYVNLQNGGLRIESGASLAADRVDFGFSSEITLDGGSLVVPGGVHGGFGLISGIGRIDADTSLGGFDFRGNRAQIAPGSAVGYAGTGLGRLEFSRDLTLDGVAIQIALGGNERGVDYDAVDVGSSLNALNAILSLSVLDSFEGRIKNSDEFEIIRTGSGLSGEISNAISGARITTSNLHGSFLVNYRTLPGGQTSIVLSDYVPIPEPSIGALCGLGLAILAGTRGRGMRGERNKAIPLLFASLSNFNVRNDR